MKLKSITFVLENCDQITIDGKYVCEFVVDDIRTSIERMACNSIQKMVVAHTFAIEIAAAANQDHAELGQPDWLVRTFHRLTSYDDICSIEFDLYDQYDETGNPKTEHYDYYLHWTGDDDYSNESQTSYISDLGNLYIVVSDTKKFEDFFDKEEINNKEAVDFRFDMCDIGRDDDYYEQSDAD